MNALHQEEVIYFESDWQDKLLMIYLCTNGKEEGKSMQLLSKSFLNNNIIVSQLFLAVAILNVLRND